MQPILLAVEIKFHSSDIHLIFVTYLNISSIEECWSKIFEDYLKLFYSSFFFDVFFKFIQFF